MALPGDHLYQPSQLAGVAAAADRGVAGDFVAAVVEMDLGPVRFAHGIHDCADHAR